MEIHAVPAYEYICLWREVTCSVMHYQTVLNGKKKNPGPLIVVYKAIYLGSGALGLGVFSQDS